MTKADIVNAVYTDAGGGYSKKESADLVDDVFETMKETLARGEKIKISGFGNFVLRDKRQRQGRNPQTGEPIVITEGNREILQENCLHCHEDMVHGLVAGATTAEDAVDCIHCHRSVGHGDAVGLGGADRGVERELRDE